MSIASKIAARLGALPFTRRDAWRFALLAAVLAVFAYHKVQLVDLHELPIIDGGYYTEVAQHVRDGEGLVTNVSLYHHGYREFPHVTPVNPLWPLVYGFAGKVSPLLAAGFAVPTALFFVAMLFAYLWGARLFPDELFPRAVPGFDAGHVAVLLFGLHAEYFRFSSLPYTEGLAYALVFAGLWRFTGHLRRPGALAGLEMGAWLGLMSLTRGQLVIVALAAFGALAWAVVFSARRRRFGAMLAVAAAVFAALNGAHLIYLWDHLADPSVAALWRFDQARANHDLSPFVTMVQTDGLLDYLRDRAGGFPVAFAMEGRHAYASSFHLFQYALPAAVPFLLVGAALAVRRGQLTETWAQLRGDAAVPWIFVVLLAAAGFLSIHTLHKEFFQEWNFARRQGITAGFAFFLALVFLLRQRHFPAVLIGVFMLASSAYLGYGSMQETVATAEKYSEYTPETFKRGLVRWLQRARDERDALKVALGAHEPQRVGFLTQGIGYHWVDSRTSFEDLRVLVEEHEIDYLILPPKSRGWRMRKARKRFSRLMEQAGKPRAGMQIFTPRERGADDGGGER